MNDNPYFNIINPFSGILFALFSPKRYHIVKRLLLIFLSILPLLATPAQEHRIASILKSRFLQAYPTMQIDHIDLRPTSSLVRRLADYEVAAVTVTRDTLRRSRGNVMVTFQKGAKKRKLYYKYRIDATITLYTAARTLPKGAPLASGNVVRKTIPFTTLYRHPIDGSALGSYITKHRIKEGRILSPDQLKKRMTVQRNDRVTAIVRDGGLSLSFEATALGEGDVGDVIKIRKDYKHRFRARILSHGRVEVIE